MNIRDIIQTSGNTDLFIHLLYMLVTVLSPRTWLIWVYRLVQLFFHIKASDWITTRLTVNYQKMRTAYRQQTKVQCMCTNEICNSHY